MKPLRVSAESSQPILSAIDFKTIFHKTDEMLELHREFYTDLEPRVENWNDGQLIGDLFTIIVSVAFTKGSHISCVKNLFILF